MGHLRGGPILLSATIIAVLAAPLAAGETQTTREEVAALLFPGETMVDVSVSLTDTQRKAIAKASGAKVPSREVHAWRASRGGWLLFDHEIGKHEFIDFALALEADGSVRGVEILAYRETYGEEVRNPLWRAQFKGRSAESPLKLHEDIQGMTGATISSRSITKGVRRLLQTWRLVLRVP